MVCSTLLSHYNSALYLADHAMQKKKDPDPLKDDSKWTVSIDNTSV